jgi:8-oxo-dGTP pyrophosphatase MutT (NUDIX family)
VSDPYQRLSKREIYRNPWIVVEAHEIVHPNGAAGEHVLIGTGSASGVLVAEGDDFILARQPRFGAQSWQIEIVKGGTDPGESIFECAQRELREELGIEASEWSDLGVAYEIPSIIDHPVTLFVASGISHTSSDQEHVETVEVVRMKKSDAYAAAFDGRIVDAVTIAALFRYRGVT